MRFRNVLLSGGILLLLGAGLTFSLWGTEVLGRLRGEPTYQGLCASSWRQEALRWQIIMCSNYNGFTTRTRYRLSPAWMRWLPWREDSSVFPIEELPLLKGDPEATSVLRILLRDSDPRIRLIAAEGLGRIGQQAQEAIPDLLECLDEPDPAVRQAVEDAVFRIDWERARNAGLGKGRWWR